VSEIDHAIWDRDGGQVQVKDTEKAVLFGQAPSVPPKLKHEYWSEKPQKETEAFAYYRRTHTANERRRRGEMRDLFEKLKITLGLLHSSKVSKSLILTRVSKYSV
jgi:hypothetical protein